MVKKGTIAVLGATGKVGAEVLKVLSQQGWSAGQVRAISSVRSSNKKLSFGTDILYTKAIDEFNFAEADIAICALNNSLASHYIPKIVADGCIVVDNSSYFRNDPDVPLVIPEINAAAIAGYRQKKIVANPNCSTIQLLMVAYPLHRVVPIKKIVVATYQSVSGAGKDAMDELYFQTKAKYTLDQVPNKVLPKPISFNLIPQIDVLLEDGYSQEELKVRLETQKILGEEVLVDATCVRVPVFVGHSEAVHIEFSDEISPQEAIEILSDAPGVSLFNHYKNYHTPLDVVGEDEVFVSRVRQLAAQKNTLNMWIVSDNLRKGAALNAVQIADILLQHYLF